MGGVLPIDLTLEILHRLPVKSLLRFQSVSESWGCLMHDPDFIARHIRQVAESNSSTIITTNSKHDANVSFSRIDSPPNLLSFSCKVNQDLEVIGSCNGLLCLVFQSHFVIISNLLIKDHHMIPMPSSICCKEVSDFVQVGFGYDSVKDDYKVVAILSHRDGNSGYRIADTSIYSLRCNIWSLSKRLELNAVSTRKESPYLACDNGIVVSGALHWLAVDRYKQFIIAFHLTTEEFYEMSLPDQASEDVMITSLTRMGVLNGCLCISSGYWSCHPYHDIWVVKEYGIHASWTKLFRFIPSLGRGHVGVLATTPLIHFKKEDQVLLLQEDAKPYSFHWYDMRDKKKMKCVSSYVEPISWCKVKAICSSTIVCLSDYRASWEESSSIWKGRLRKRRRKEDSSSRGTNRIDDDVEKAFFNVRNQFIEGFSCNL